MKSLVIVTGSLGSGGIEKVTSLIANFYAKKGYKVSICCLLQSNSNVFVDLDKSIEIYFFRPRKPNKKKIFRVIEWINFLRKIFKTIEPNYILAMTLKIGALCSVARDKKKSRLVFRETSDPKSIARNRFFDFLLCFMCININGVIFQTNWEKSCYPKFIQKKGRVIPNPISVAFSSKQIPKEKVIVASGRLYNFQKKHDELIRAFQVFSMQHPDYSLEIYGDGPDKENNIKLIASLGLNGKVNIIPAQKDIHMLIKRAKVYVLSSAFEGLSNALVEAMLLGVPCISSDWPGVKEIITHEENGLIYKRNDFKQLASFITLLVEDDKRGEYMASNGMLQKDRYDPNIILKKYSEIIEGDN